MSRTQIEAALLTDVGMKRKQNQDNGLILPEYGVFAVADGMGGHLGGETASQICVESIDEVIKATAKKSLDDPQILQQCVTQANLKIFEQSNKDARLKGMGTTVTILKITGKIATIAQVGDSRAYLWNAQGMWQLTRDHSLVQEKLRAGLITQDQIKSDQMKNVITRSVGYDPILRTDFFSFPVEPGDGFLICSDGLTGPLEEAEIFAILEGTMKSTLTLDEAARELIDSANEKGGEDNITAILVRFE